MKKHGAGPENKKIQYRFPNSSDLESLRVTQLTALINRVYDDAESGLWSVKGHRTTDREVRKLLLSNEIVLAQQNESVVGCVKVKLLGEGIGEFGMLVADSAVRGQGIGSGLITAAEQWAKSQGCHKMQLELLTPRTWKHPSKEALKVWYSRIQYVPQFTEPFEKYHADIASQLATTCDFTIWHKQL